VSAHFPPPRPSPGSSESFSSLKAAWRCQRMLKEKIRAGTDPPRERRHTARYVVPVMHAFAAAAGVTRWQR